MKISVLITTYNHENYIAACLDSVLTQETEFEYEILVGEDDSSDATREICRQYAENYPERIRLFLNNRKDVLYVEGRPTGRANFLNLIQQAQGTYIARLDGDDYWTDPHKLQIMTEFMDSRSDLAVCFHDTHWLQNGKLVPKPLPFKELSAFTMDDLFMYNNFIRTGSVMYRSDAIKNPPQWINKVPFGDIAFHLLCSSHGNIGYIDRVMAVYRDHGHGVYSSASELDRIQRAIRTFTIAAQNLGKAESDSYRIGMVKLHNQLVAEAQKIASSTKAKLAPESLQIHEQRLNGTKPASRGPAASRQKQVLTASDDFRVTAIIAAYNEGDVIYHVIRDLVDQGIQVYFIDHHSTDNTVSEVSKFLGKGVLNIETFPEDAGYDIPSDVYAWRYILKRKEDVVRELGPGWYIHFDADEFREAPWLDKNLLQGIQKVAKEGFNAISFRIFDFKPVDNAFQPGEDVREYLQYYSGPQLDYDNVQIKCWEYFGQEFELWKTGGHEVLFNDRKIYPIPFILRHYPIRSQDHGLKKIFGERKNRWDKDERTAQWHAQYDHIETESHHFLAEKNKLVKYDRKAVCAALSQYDASANESLVSIIMLTWNALEYTKKCVASIEEHTHYPYEIIFVDNGSTDQTVKYLEKLTKSNPRHQLIKNSKNKGFAAGNNQGVEAAQGKYVMLLNNDVLVPGGWLTTLVESLERDEHIGAVGPITNFISGRQALTEVPYENDADFFKFAATLRQQNRNRLTPRRRLAGFAVLMKKSLYEEIGGFDTSFGVGNFEDDDLSLRIREKRYALMVDESVLLHHFGSQTFKANQIDYQTNLKERLIIFHKKWPDVDYQELLELKNGLHEKHPFQLKRATALLSEGQLAAAAELFNDVRQENPLDPDALFGLALCARNQGRNDEALTLLQRLIEINPEDAAAYNQSGIIVAETGDLENARVLIGRAIELDPTLIDAQRNLAEILLLQENYTAGVQTYIAILDQYPDNIPCLLRMAQLHEEAGNLDEAVSWSEKVLAIDPENSSARELKQTALAQ